MPCTGIGVEAFYPGLHYFNDTKADLFTSEKWIFAEEKPVAVFTHRIPWTHNHQQRRRKWKTEYTETIGTPPSKHKPAMRRAYLRQSEEVPYAVSSNRTLWTQYPLLGNHHRQWKIEYESIGKFGTPSSLSNSRDNQSTIRTSISESLNPENSFKTPTK
nr:hypothetical protein Itr_chr12CG14190 [Ipomoea trifida]